LGQYNRKSPGDNARLISFGANLARQKARLEICIVSKDNQRTMMSEFKPANPAVK